MKMIMRIILIWLLWMWSTVILAVCGYSPTIELRNSGYNDVKGHYDELTLSCPLGKLIVKTEDRNQQTGVKADKLFEDGKLGTCTLSGERNGKQENILSFKATYYCQDREQTQFGEVIISGEVSYDSNVVCGENALSCLTSNGPGLLISMGSHALQNNFNDVQSCICPVTRF